MDLAGTIADLEAEYVEIERQIRALPGLALSEQGRSVNVEAARASLQARQDWINKRLAELRPVDFTYVVRG
jgi:hypothetical protein